eukprot:TRINITY_DN1974_c0_g1_i4.p1 TRINITY_DN1974_c0_g1~~TRINITY_DN1974_c0_g1_i4.p1  ORF type:complete len:201 (-),score=10.08 TRINITY_DN1974_c0_g1_i4:362-964(-)
MKRLRYVNPSTISKSLRCSICLEPFFEPIRTPCGHVFCKECLQAWVQKKPSCPLDTTPLPTTGPFQVDFVLSELFAEFPIVCPNECSWTGLQRDVTSHLSVCPAQNVSCSNPGCKEVLPRKEIVKHQESCPHLTTNKTVVTLNVGGKKFQTLRATLMKPRHLLHSTLQWRDTCTLRLGRELFHRSRWGLVYLCVGVASYG